MTGKIVKGIAGFYYVNVVGSGIYECKAKGIFRKDNKKPLVGDQVEIEILHKDEKKGNIVQILPRKNELIRPAVANVDQAMIIFALENPAPNAALLDRFLVMMEIQRIPVVVCFNKQDLVKREEAERWEQIYRTCGYETLMLSAREETGIEELKEKMLGKTTVVAGPSGVGKSSLTNLLQGEVRMETGEISAKLKRGKHTTRHSQLICLNDQTYMMDTPGFSSLYTEGIEKEDLRMFFPELQTYEGQCRFQGCVHVNEPGCKVKEALEEGKIAQSRYKNYQMFYEELKEKEKRRY